MIKHKKYIHYTQGNIFDYLEPLLSSNDIIVPHVCNNVGIFGGGFTAGIMNRYPIVGDNYHLLGKQCKLGYTQFVTVKQNKHTNKKLIFANMIAQSDIIKSNNPRPLNYYALANCMKTILDYINANLDKSETQIHAPKFGSGLAGGNWSFIADLISDIWMPLEIFVYSYPNRHTRGR